MAQNNQNFSIFGNQNDPIPRQCYFFLFSYWNLIRAYYLGIEVKVRGPSQIHLGAQKAQNELKRCKTIKILISLSVKAVQFQGRAEFYVKSLSCDIGKLWGDENYDKRPLEDPSKSLNGLKVTKNKQNYDICQYDLSNFMGLLNFLSSSCLLILNGNKSILGDSLVIHARA